MTRIIQKARVETSALIVMTEDEIKALDYLAGYGADTIIRALADKLSPSVANHTKALTSFFDAIRNDAPLFLNRVKAARDAFGDAP